MNNKLQNPGWGQQLKTGNGQNHLVRRKKQPKNSPQMNNNLQNPGWGQQPKKGNGHTHLVRRE